MSDEVRLTLRRQPERAVDLGAVRFSGFGAMSAAEIARTPFVDGGRTSVPLGELFTVSGERAAVVRIIGDLARFERLGAGHDAGELVLEGPVGREVGAGMVGGRIAVRGNAGWGAGLGMAGGVLEIVGDAGSRAGGAAPGAKRGMTGGTLVIRGSAGAEAGASMRRGLVAIAGDAGPGAGRATIAGTVVIFGATGPDAGQWSRRGSIVALGTVAPPPTYRYACSYRPQYVSLLLKHLEERHRLPAGRARDTGLFRRYSGDLAELGAGEILAWTPQ
ncbi:MAG TPA: formylmethanofuran dehydrogenase subunit C [Gemmatimonadales bacterium]|nr:formylmethanofuran dehydrogenase subunit C [Gemmatimonadales bacterium]